MCCCARIPSLLLLLLRCPPQDASSGNTYYYNRMTGATQWAKPQEFLVGVSDPVADAWQEIKDPASNKVRGPPVTAAVDVVLFRAAVWWSCVGVRLDSQVLLLLCCPTALNPVGPA